MRIEKLFVLVECPYCGKANRNVLLTDAYATVSVVYCAKKFGGCNRAYVLRVSHEPEIEGMTFGIDDHDTLKLPI